jgi:hypothetical protein
MNASKSQTEQRQFEVLKDALNNLDRNLYKLEELYFLFAKKFNLHEINFQIYFEMFSKNVEYPEDIYENYENYFNYILTNRYFKWPFNIVPLFNKIFINLIETKTRYESFYSMLRENNFENVLNVVIPMQYLIVKIESMNWNLILKEKDIDFEQKSMLPFDAADNPFWFPQYLKECVQLP